MQKNFKIAFNNIKTQDKIQFFQVMQFCNQLDNRFSLGILIVAKHH